NERTSTGMSGRPPETDPLAELARLIGQDDPFRGARPDAARATPRRESTPPYVESPDAAPGWLTRHGGAAAPHDRFAEPTYEAGHDADARYEERAPDHDPHHEAGSYEGT